VNSNTPANFRHRFTRITFLVLTGFISPSSGDGAPAGAPVAPPSMVPTARTPIEASVLRAFAAQTEAELRENILPFWMRHAPEGEQGFVGRIGHDMTRHPQAPRGVLLTSRILWTFSAAQGRYPTPGYAGMARRAYRDLVERGLDSEHGGAFWTVSPTGEPVDARKHVYGQAFALYALSEYARAFDQSEAKERAIQLFRLVEKHARDHRHGGYFEAFDRTWRRDTAALRLLGTGAPKSQNTHIHIMEAYTNLLRVWPDPELREAQRALIELMLTRILNPATNHLQLFFREDWTPVSHEISYGHDIELSWLVVEAAEVLGDEALVARAKAAAVAMAEATLREGVDRDGGVFNEGGPHGVTKDTKDWWPQAEAAVGFLNAYEISGDVRFFDAARQTWAFVAKHVVDRERGDWHESLSRDGTPLPRTKLSVWKCPYHNGRACLELAARLRALAGK
jgi:cellobiose epimerase